jgi:hypothetical protein
VSPAVTSLLVVGAGQPQAPLDHHEQAVAQIAGLHQRGPDDQGHRLEIPRDLRQEIRAETAEEARRAHHLDHLRVLAARHRFHGRLQRRIGATTLAHRRRFSSPVRGKSTSWSTETRQNGMTCHSAAPAQFFAAVPTICYRALVT